MKNSILIFIVFILISCNSNNYEQTEDELNQEQSQVEVLLKEMKDAKIENAQIIALKYKIEKEDAKYILEEYSNFHKSSRLNRLAILMEKRKNKNFEYSLTNFINKLSNKTGYDTSIISSFIIDYKCAFENNEY